MINSLFLPSRISNSNAHQLEQPIIITPKKNNNPHKMAASALFTRTLGRGGIRSSPLNRAIGLGLTSSTLLLYGIHNNQRPMRLDYASSSPASPTSPTVTQVNGYATKRKDRLDPDVIRQLSGGSLSGFVAGLLVSSFSKTLVLLGGIALAILQVTSHYALRYGGVNLSQKIRERVPNTTSRILAALNLHMAFKLSFAIAFALSAFMSF
ncbi:putative fun14 family protein [Cladorrhinum sp. PSN259]|nr:putative fun14 family protein [Cladorrhinum sp. PSN259]